jgi:hypothetical protein
MQQAHQQQQQQQQYYPQQQWLVMPQHQQQQQQHAVPGADAMLVDTPHIAAGVSRQPVQQPNPQPQGGGTSLVTKMLSDLQSINRSCSSVQGYLQQFEYELTHDPAATEAAAVAGPKTQQEVCTTLAAVATCRQQQAALQKLLTDTMQLLQPALTEQERQRLQMNSVQLAPALEGVADKLSEVCRLVLRAAVAQDAAACAAAAVTAGAARNAAAVDALAAVGCGGHLATLQRVIAPSLDSIPAGSARAQRMARLSRAIKASQESMASARRALRGQT